MGAFRGISASGGMVNSYAFRGARGGGSSYSRYGKARRRAWRPNGYTRRAGFYGRFGTGRGRGAQVEKKYFDTQQDYVCDLTVENVGNLQGIVQGTSPNGRVGSKIIVKSIQWRGNVVLPAGAQSNDTVVLILVQDTQTNGALATCQDVYDSATAATMMRNIENGSRFKVLCKINVELNANAGVSGAYDGDQKLVEGFMKVNIPISFKGGTGAITEVKTNGLFWLAGATVTDDYCGVSMKTRLRYTDI